RSRSSRDEPWRARRGSKTWRRSARVETLHPPGASRGGEPSRDGEGAVALRGEDHHLGHGRAHADEGHDVGAVGHQDPVAAGALLAGEGAEGSRLLGLPGPVGEERAQGLPRLGRSEGQPRGLETPAPAAREHPLDPDRASLEGRADPSRLLATRLGQIALGHTVVHPKAGWVADSGGGRGVTEEHDLAALREQAPEALVGARGPRGPPSRAGSRRARRAASRARGGARRTWYTASQAGR